jgi:hypothetical protein
MRYSEPVSTKTPAQVKTIKDPLARISSARAAAKETRARYEATEREYSAVIAGAVRELLDGRSLAAVAELLGVSRQRVHQMSRVPKQDR